MGILPVFWIAIKSALMRFRTAVSKYLFAAERALQTGNVRHHHELLAQSVKVFHLFGGHVAVTAEGTFSSHIHHSLGLRFTAAKNPSFPSQNERTPQSCLSGVQSAEPWLYGIARRCLTGLFFAPS
ncbi:hypothetical protein [Magnetococcus marinus]|uniref:hypothetical protein n=1 Tax=Magnetococcus marinus TaxID=1124597 RepID=UPI0005A2902A|nr:hypothetical protein [Magnetococcus marinus]